MKKRLTTVVIGIMLMAVLSLWSAGIPNAGAAGKQQRTFDNNSGVKIAHGASRHPERKKKDILAQRRRGAERRRKKKTGFLNVKEFYPCSSV